MKKGLKESKKEIPIIGKLDTSVISLIFANLIPLFGILFLGWDLFSIMILFWIESAVIGFYAILKMIISPIINQTEAFNILPRSALIVISLIQKIVLVPFFILHYGGFMMVHLFFIFTFFKPSNFFDAGPLISFSKLMPLVYPMIIAIIALFISHGISFYNNFIKKQEYKKLNLNESMFDPYKRIIIMQVTLIIGAFLVTLFNLPAMMAGLLVFLKIIVDLKAHNKSHEKKSNSKIIEDLMIKEFGKKNRSQNGFSPQLLKP
jgi:hypothetical protein